MQPRYKALLVHLLTATGAVLSMLAMLAAVNAEWSMMFLWLGFATRVVLYGFGRRRVPAPRTPLRRARAMFWRRSGSRGR